MEALMMQYILFGTYAKSAHFYQERDVHIDLTLC